MAELAPTHWIAECADRLQARWHTLDRVQLEEVAVELWGDARWRGMAPAQAAVVCGASRATAYRVLERYRAGGWEALRDRPSVARTHPARLSAEAEAQIVGLRARTGWGPKRLAGVLGWPAATVWRVLRRHGVSRRVHAPRPPANCA